LQWQKSLGGTNDEFATLIQNTNDGGYIVTGVTESGDGDVSGYHSNYDIWVAKLNDTGGLQWQRCLGGSGYDDAPTIEQTTDSGYIIAGYSASTNGDATGNGNHGSYDYWIIKLSSTGTIQWQKAYGGSGEDDVNTVKQTADGGYIVAGSLESNDGEVTGNHGMYDGWVVKLDDTGAIQWQKTLGGSDMDFIYAATQTTDGGYIAGGFTKSTDGDVTNALGAYDYWVVKLSSAGAIQWQKSYGGTSDDEAYYIMQTSDGGYALTGSSTSIDGDVTGNHGSEDYWIVKLDDTGAIQWQKSLGGSGEEQSYYMTQTTDGGYAISGKSNSHDGDISVTYGGDDYWVVKLSSTGGLQWEASLGGSDDDVAASLQQTPDGGLIVAGFSSSHDSDVTASLGGVDFWIAKMGAVTGVAAVSALAPVINIYPNPAHDVINISSKENITTELTDVAGRVVLPLSSKTQLNIAALPAGSYLFNVYDTKGMKLKTEKVTKQ